MDDPQFAIRRIGTILESARSWNEPGKLAAFAAATRLLDEIDKHIDDLEESGDLISVVDSGYASEKAAGLYWHIGAMMGCAPDGGHDPDQHHVWAIAALEGIEHGLTPS